MPTNSRQKGKRYELEVAAMLRGYGFEARRGQQFSGSPDSPDVVTNLDDFLHIECKRCEQMRLYDWISQAEDDSGDDQFPVVIHRKSKEQSLVTMTALDFFCIINRLLEAEGV